MSDAAAPLETTAESVYLRHLRSHDGTCSVDGDHWPCDAFGDAVRTLCLRAHPELFDEGTSAMSRAP